MIYTYSEFMSVVFNSLACLILFAHLDVRQGSACLRLIVKYGKKVSLMKVGSYYFVHPLILISVTALPLG